MGYTDADWARPGHKSTSGYVFMIDGGAASWMSQTQPVVALSAARTECIAASEAVKGTLYLHKLMAEMRQAIQNGTFGEFHRSFLRDCDANYAIIDAST